MAGVNSDNSSAWTKKHGALRTNVNLDLTTAMSIRRPTVAASASSTSTDTTTRMRDYYADVANSY